MHAYAVSIHKSQGSEFPAVVVPLLLSHYMMLQRNLLYTAVTRAKRLVVPVSAERAITIAVRNDKAKERYSGLAERLRRSAYCMDVRETEDAARFPCPASAWLTEVSHAHRHVITRTR